MRTCKGREHYADALKAKIPNLLVSFDTFTDTGLNDTAYQNFQQALQMAGDSPCVHIEDDIILCDNFIERIMQQIAQRQNDVIQFFSMRKDDIEIGSRYESGAKFMMAQCFYLPNGLSKAIYNFSLTFQDGRNERNAPIDPCVADYLKHSKMKYWVCVPNLVDHIEGVSKIDKRRSSKRLSKTFNK